MAGAGTNPEIVCLAFLGAPLLRQPMTSSPWSPSFGRRLSSILETCPTQQSFQQQDLDDFDLRSFENLDVSGVIAPVGVENTAGATLLRAFKEPKVVTPLDPWLLALQKCCQCYCAKYTGLGAVF